MNRFLWVHQFLIDFLEKDVQGLSMGISPSKCDPVWYPSPMLIHLECLNNPCFLWLERLSCRANTNLSRDYRVKTLAGLSAFFIFFLVARTKSTILADFERFPAESKLDFVLAAAGFDSINQPVCTILGPANLFAWVPWLRVAGWACGWNCHWSW